MQRLVYLGKMVYTFDTLGMKAIVVAGISHFAAQNMSALAITTT